MIKEILFPAFLETIYMVLISSLFAVVLGFIPGIVLAVTHEGGLKPCVKLYKVLDFLVNIFRSFPFVILMIAILPITKFIVHKRIGTNAAIVPLVAAAIPFVARIIESALKEVDYGIIEAAKSFGMNNFRIITKVMIVEAMPQIVNGITLTVISIIGYSAMAGAVGGGGLGAVAIQYGYNMFRTDIMIYTVIILITIVQVIQSFGIIIYKRIK